MGKGLELDGVLLTWGDRLFYPGNRMVRARAQPKLTGDAASRRAAEIRRRVEATVRREPQVMVKVTGGGRSMRAIAAHFRYISKNGRLDVEDDRGEVMRGQNLVRDLAEEWKFSGIPIPDEVEGRARREAFNIMLSMPRGTDPLAVQQAARAFARTELADHKYVMVLHDHQANPHVHISVRAESRYGVRLNPRKSDLHRWREGFAEKLRELGVEAEASRRHTRGVTRHNEPLWRLKAREEGRVRRPEPQRTAASPRGEGHENARTCWIRIAQALAQAGNSADVRLAASIMEFVKGAPAQHLDRGDQRPVTASHDRGPTRSR